MSNFDVIVGLLKDEVFELTMERAELRRRLALALKEKRRLERANAQILRDLRSAPQPVPAVPLLGVIS